MVIKSVYVFSIMVTSTIFIGCSDDKTINMLANRALIKEGYHEITLRESSISDFEILGGCRKGEERLIFTAKDDKNITLNGEVCTNGRDSSRWPIWLQWAGESTEVKLSK